MWQILLSKLSTCVCQVIPRNLCHNPPQSYVFSGNPFFNFDFIFPCFNFSCRSYFSDFRESDGKPNIDSNTIQQNCLNSSPFLSHRSRTPLEKEFETWIYRLQPGFSHVDVEAALLSQSDPDLAFDIFRWTAQQRNYRHNSTAYQTMIQISISGRRYGQAETLIEEVIAGACEGTVPLFNLIIKFCCSRRSLFNKAFDIFKKMQTIPNCKPSLESYTQLLHCILRRFGRLNVSHVYMHGVRSLVKQMKASGVIPDTFTLNLIIKAYSRCLKMDEALRVYREMGLYGCEPNNYTYSYIIKGLCEKGWLGQGFGFYKEMRQKGLVPTSSAYMILICSLSMERSSETAIAVLHDMFNNSMLPDHLTYRTLLEGLCMEGKQDSAFELLERLKKECPMDGRLYSDLLNTLYAHSKDE